MNDSSPSQLPLCRPSLPTVEKLVPYLRDIDQNRWYTNYGPLEADFRARLGPNFDCGGEEIVTVANGTQGLIVALRLLTEDAPRDALVMVPAWTFIATGLAVVQAGLTPWLVDIDEDAWTLTPDLARQHLSKAPGPVCAVLTVAPFGAAPQAEAWERFADETGLAVIVDAAASFDAVTVSKLPTIISLHATKAFGVGEGGLILCRDKAFCTKAQNAVNFGFAGKRQSEELGTNAKFSEYAAAVGLAQIDIWPERRAYLTALRDAYNDRFKRINGVRLSPGSEDGVTGTYNVRLDCDVEPVIEALATEGIECRRWWGDGLHHHPSLSTMPRQDLETCSALARSVIGLPFGVDITVEDANRVADRVMEVARLF